MSEINKIVAGIGDAILEATKRSKAELKAYIDKELDTHKFSGTQIKQNTIPGLALTNGAVPLIKIGGLQAEIANIAVAEIASATIDFAQINNVLIKTAQIDDAAITNAKIENAAITSAKIGNAEIKTANIDDASITTAKINDAAISTAKIQDAAIETAKIKDAAIESAKIKDAAITNAKIGEAAIGSANIQDAAITNAKINSAGIDYAHIKDLDAESAYFGTSVFELGIGDELYIGRLRVNAANIAHLEVGELILEDANGDLYKIGVDEFGNVVTSLYEVQYQNIADATKNLISQYTIYKGASAPASPYVGQMWISSYDDIIRRCISIDPTVEWQTVNSAELHTSFINAVETGIDILSTGRILAQSGGEIKIAGGAAINVDALGEINISAGGSINVESAADINVASGGNINVNSGADINVAAEGSINVAPEGDINVSAGGKINVASADDILINGQGMVSVIAEDVVVAAEGTIRLTVQDEVEIKLEDGSITSSVISSEEYRGDLSAISDQFLDIQDLIESSLDLSNNDTIATKAYVQTIQSTEIEQRNNAIEISVSEEKKRAVAAENGIKEFTDRAATYFSFDIDGLRLGKLDSEFGTLLGNEKLSFLQGGDEVAYIQYNRLYINAAEVQKMLTIGNTDPDRGAVVGFTDIVTTKYSDGTGGVSAIWRAE